MNRSGLMQLYNKGAANALIAVGDGTRKSSYIAWLKKERERIIADPTRRAAIHTHGDGKVSLWVNPHPDLREAERPEDRAERALERLRKRMGK